MFAPLSALLSKISCTVSKMWFPLLVVDTIMLSYLRLLGKVDHDTGDAPGIMNVVRDLVSKRTEANFIGTCKADDKCEF